MALSGRSPTPAQGALPGRCRLHTPDNAWAAAAGWRARAERGQPGTGPQHPPHPAQWSEGERDTKKTPGSGVPEASVISRGGGVLIISPGCALGIKSAATLPPPEAGSLQPKHPALRRRGARPLENVRREVLRLRVTDPRFHIFRQLFSQFKGQIF